MWSHAVCGGQWGVLCKIESFYTSMFSPGNSGFVEMARDTVHVDGVLQLPTTLDSVCDNQTWLERTHWDANDVLLDASPSFLPYGDISIHGVAYASVNNSHAHTRLRDNDDRIDVRNSDVTATQSSPLHATDESPSE